jgi:hypothetical protein
MWMLYLDSSASDAQPVVFGHSGSDGTGAWVWPDLDLMVLYFTQSRGGLTVLRFEEVIDRLLIHPERAVPTAQPAEDLKPYLGSFTAHSGPLRNQQYDIVAHNGQLAVDIPAGLILDLEEATELGYWRIAIDPTARVSFLRDSSGAVTAMLLHLPSGTFELARGEARPEPEVDIQAVLNYLGSYRDEENNRTLAVVLYEGHLAVILPEATLPALLCGPDEQGRWAFCLNPTVSISFQEQDGEVVSFTAHTPDGDIVRPRIRP